MNKTLNQIAQEIVVTQAQLELSQGEIDQYKELEIEQLSQELTTKTDHWGYRIDKLLNMAQFWSNKASEAKAIAKSIEDHANNMKSKMKDTMQLLDKKEISGEAYRFTIRPTSKPKLIMHENEQPPVEYLMQVITTKYDNERIKADLMAGIEMNGCHLEQGMTLNIGYKKE